MDQLRRVCSICGPTILLAAWLTQQFLFDHWNSKLNRLDSYELVWQSYRSNNYIFNALAKYSQVARGKEPPEDEENKQNDEVAHWQYRNLQVVYDKVKALIDPELFATARSEVADAEDGGFGGLNGHMDIQFKTIFLAIERERERLLQKKQNAGYTFWSFYLLGTIATILGTILKEVLEYRKQKGSVPTAAGRIAGGSNNSSRERKPSEPRPARHLGTDRDLGDWPWQWK